MKKILAIVLVAVMALATVSAVMAAEKSDTAAILMDARVGSDKTVSLDVKLSLPDGYDGVRSGKFVLSYKADPDGNVSYKGYTPGGYFADTGATSLMCNENNSSEKIIAAFASQNAIKSSELIATFEFAYEKAGTLEFALELEELTASDTVTLIDADVDENLLVELPDATVAPETTAPAPTTTAPVTDDPVPTDPVATYYTVTFVDWDGKVLAEVEVAEGEAAEAPAEEPTRENWVFAGWDADFTKVTEDMTVKAVYYKLGDVNLNGEPDAGDGTLVLREVVGSSDGPLSELQLKIADVNGTGTIDAGDATMILRHAVGTETIDYGE